MLVLIFAPNDLARRNRWLAGAFATTFLGVAAFVVATLIGLYAEGAQAKSRAMATSLAQRLGNIVSYNLNFEDIQGIDDVFTEYFRLAPELHSISLTVQDKIFFHTDPKQVGRFWVHDNNNFEFAAALTPLDHPRPVRVTVALPKAAIYWQVLRSVKNFAALFIASGLMALMLMQVLSSLKARTMRNASAGREEHDLTLVKPIFFLAVFVEHMSYAFLPQFVHNLAAEAGLQQGWASAPFMAYYLCFALALMPSGRYESRIGPRPLILGGMVTAAMGMILLFLLDSFHMVLAARALSGIGQGMLFIGVQAYVLANASPERRTQAASIIVFGFQGGMISGMAIGSLLVSQLAPQGVFALAAWVATLTALFALFAVPARAGTTDANMRTASEIWADIAATMRDARFVKSMMLIGVPAKAILTGVILFAMPLILSRLGFAQEDIGQITMVYAASVIGAGAYASRIADRTGSTDQILFWGSTICAAGLALVALGDVVKAQNPDSLFPVTAVVLTGAILIGIAHGFINAPVLTHVAESEIAHKIGAGPVAATYRFLERVGHTMGPIILGQMFVAFGQTSTTLFWVAGAVLLFGLLFIVRSAPGKQNQSKHEFAS